MVASVIPEQGKSGVVPELDAEEGLLPDDDEEGLIKDSPARLVSEDPAVKVESPQGDRPAGESSHRKSSKRDKESKHKHKEKDRDRDRDRDRDHKKRKRSHKEPRDKEPGDKEPKDKEASDKHREHKRRGRSDELQEGEVPGNGSEDGSKQVIAVHESPRAEGHRALEPHPARADTHDMRANSRERDAAQTGKDRSTNRRHVEHDRVRDADRQRQAERPRDSERERNRERDREREWDRGREREKENDRAKEREREKDRERDSRRERERGEADRGRAGDRQRPESYAQDDRSADWRKRKEREGEARTDGMSERPPHPSEAAVLAQERVSAKPAAVAADAVPSSLATAIKSEPGSVPPKPATGAIVKKEPLSLEELLRKRQEADTEAARPKFMTKKDREALALKKCAAFYCRGK